MANRTYTDEEVELMGIQFRQLKDMTFTQFITAIETGRLVINVPHRPTIEEEMKQYGGSSTR